jgi:hypothetical protein
MHIINGRLGKTRSAAVAGLIAISVALPCASFQQQDFSADRRPRPQSNLSISLQSLLTFLSSSEGDHSSEAIAIKLIEIHGLSFRPTADDLEKLRRASASESFLKAIETAVTPAPVVRQGRLAVGCEPMECEVWVSGNLIGITARGELPWITLPEGKVIVSAAKTNYDPIQDKQEVLIRQNELTRIKFQFKISRAGLVATGAKLFQQMRRSIRSGEGEAAGAAPAEQEGNALRAAGTLYLYDSAGCCTLWPVKAWFREGHETRFELSRFHAQLQERYVLTMTASGHSWDRTPPAKEAHELEVGIRLIVEGQLPRLMERLDEPGLTMVAVDAPLGSEVTPVFRAEGGSQAYLITLDTAYRPSEIKAEPPVPGSGFRMQYSDYVLLGSVYYPRTTQIILHDGAQGVEARFDTVQIVSSQNSYKQLSSKHSKLR